ncbi:MAG: hypothetical protein ACQET8_23000 [Bacillota bacterium]
MKDLANPYCDKCGGTGELNNGYFNYPCNCVRMKPLNIGEQPLIRDTYLKPIPKGMGFIDLYDEAEKIINSIKSLDEKGVNELIKLAGDDEGFTKAIMDIRKY